MKHALPPLALLLLSVPLSGQVSVEINEGLRMVPNFVNPSLPYTLEWWGREDHFYFILQSDEVTSTTTYFPYAVVGSDALAGLDLDSSAEMLFFRLHYTDDPSAPPAILDFDGDGISNADELLAGPPFDPFTPQPVVDTNSNDIPDYWEMFYFGNLNRDGSGDYNTDGIIDRFKWQARANPTVDESENVHLRRSFSYDPMGRLVEITGLNTHTIQHDAEGNVEAAK